MKYLIIIINNNYSFISTKNELSDLVYGRIPKEGFGEDDAIDGLKVTNVNSLTNVNVFVLYYKSYFLLYNLPRH